VRWSTLTAIATDGRASLWGTREDGAGEVVLSLDTGAPAAEPAEAAPGSPRIVNLCLAGGSLALAAAGAILPGIPSQPFLVLTGHYSIRLSPRLHRYLTRQRWFVALMGKSDGSGHLPGLDRRSLLKMLGIAVLVAAAFLIVHPPLPLVLGIELGLLAFFCIRNLGRMSLGEAGLAALGLESWDQFALAA
jgi:uncharacterized membrane protein YbaN (DUF454 family)